MAASSALAFSSSRRRTDLSQSKMPPQQGDGLLDVVDGAYDFGAHAGLVRWSGDIGGVLRFVKARSVEAARTLADVAGCGAGRGGRARTDHAIARRAGL